jgi:hypothetical protein
MAGIMSEYENAPCFTPTIATAGAAQTPRTTIENYDTPKQITCPKFASGLTPLADGVFVTPQWSPLPGARALLATTAGPRSKVFRAHSTDSGSVNLTFDALSDCDWGNDAAPMKICVEGLLSFASTRKSGLVLMDDFFRDFHKHCHDDKKKFRQAFQDLRQNLRQPAGGSRGRKKAVTVHQVCNAILAEVVSVLDDFEADPEKKLVSVFEDDDGMIDVLKPPCTMSFEIPSIDRVVKLVASLGRWPMIDTDGTNIYDLHCAVLIDTLMIGVSLQSAAGVVPVDDLRSKSVTVTSYSFSGGSLTISLSLQARVAACALEATQIVCAASLAAAWENRDEVPFSVAMQKATLAVMLSLQQYGNNNSKEVARLTKALEGYSTTNLRSQQEALASMASDSADAVILFDSALTIGGLGKEVSEAVKDEGVTRGSMVDGGDLSPIMHCINAFSGETDSQVGAGVVKLCQALYIRKRTLENNRLMSLLGVRAKSDTGTVRGLHVTHKLGDHSSPKEADRTLSEASARDQSRNVVATRSGVRLVRAFDNATDSGGSNGAQRVLKNKSAYVATAAYSAFPKSGYEANKSTKVPTTLFEGNLVSGPAVELSKSAKEWTLKGVNVQTGKTHEALLVECIEKLQAARMRKAMFTALKDRRDFRGYVLPKVGPFALNLDSIAQQLHPNVSLKEAIKQFVYPLMPFNECSAVGCSRALVRLLLLDGVDVTDVCRRLIDTHDDKLMQMIFGDHATLEGLENNQRRALSTVAMLAEDPDIDLASNSGALDSVFVLLCTTCAYYQRGDLHGNFSLTDSRVKIFDAWILRYLRFYYEHFRNLQGDSHKVKEDDAWRDLLSLFDEASMDASCQAFLDTCKNDILASKSIEALSEAYKRFQKKSVCGDGVYDENDLSNIDQPCLQLHSSMFMGFVQDLFSKAEFAGCEPVKVAVYVFMLPIYKLLKKKNYAWVSCRVVGFLLASSPEARDFLSAHNGLSNVNGAPNQAPDRHCEHVVETVTEGPRQGSEEQLSARGMRHAIGQRFKRWGRSFAEVAESAHGLKGTARLPSRKAIYHDLLKGMAYRPTSPRTQIQPFMRANANKRTCTIPTAFFSEMIVQVYTNSWML